MWNFLGDWITPHGSESDVNSAENILFNNCYLHYITELTANISTILGEDAAAARYHADAAKLAVAVTRAYSNASTGVYLDRLQTHAVMPLASGVAGGGGVEAKTWEVLEGAISVGSTVGGHSYPNHLDTGLTGTYFMTKVLMESGRNDLVFAYANQTTFPSYGYFLSLGRTTWPEDWSGNYGSSLLHGCFNGIGLWFVEGVAGIHVHMSEAFPLTIRAGVDAGDITWADGERVAFSGKAKSSSVVETHPRRVFPRRDHPGTRREPYNPTPMAVSSISPAHLHVVELAESRKIPNPNFLPRVFVCRPTESKPACSSPRPTARTRPG